MKKSWLFVVLLIAAGVWLGWRMLYSEKTGQSAKTGAATTQLSTRDSASAKPEPGKSAPAVAVQLVEVQHKDLPIVVEVNASVTPIDSVDIRSQITSTVNQVLVKEGQFVKQGEVLFKLDDRNDQANVEKARAQLARDEALLADLERQALRNKELVDKNFVSAAATQTLDSQVQSQRALINADKAALLSAQTSLSYNVIRAPISGRIGLISVAKGGLVSSGATSSPLLTIVQMSPISVSFSLPERYLPLLFKAQQTSAPVLINPAGETNSIRGNLSFIDNKVDSTNGTIRVKAKFDNPQNKLWPGQFVTAKLQLDLLKDALVVPVASIITNIDGQSVYVALSDGKVEQRKIEVLNTQNEWAAVSGLQLGEKIVQEGKQNLRPGGTWTVMSAPAKAASKAASKAKAS